MSATAERDEIKIGEIAGMETRYGQFAENSSAFHINTADIPRNWYNYLWNDGYITFVSQTGAGNGFLQDDMGRRIELVQDRCLFILEGDDHWGISGLPVEEDRDAFCCTHDLGYTVIHTEKAEISTDLIFFVPDGENGEIWNLKMKNKSDRERHLKVMGYFGTAMDGGYVRQGYHTGVADWDETLEGVVHQGWCDFYGQKGRTFYGYMTMTERADEFSGAANAFIGPYGSLAYPLAVRRGALSNQGCNSEKLGFALSKELMLKAGEEKELTFLCGIAFSMEVAADIKDRLTENGAVQRELDVVKEKFLNQTAGVKIRTPDEVLNQFFAWSKHQANLGSRWARVRHNGYRDMTSDCDCLAAINPRLALERFKRVLTYQYSNGYAPRTFLDGVIKDNNFADNTVWIVFTAMSILKEMGDKSILDLPVKFNDGTEASLYEHVKRSMDFLYHFRGLHGLIRIWGGDWNDCMNTAGLQGKGVSVWLSLAWLRANKMFTELAMLAGRSEDAELADQRSKEMQKIIEDYGWDGEYYLCAYNDWEEKIGSRECEEGQMFLIPQIWSVFSGVSDCGREVKAMDAVEEKLASDLGIVVSRPPYTKYDPHIGNVTQKPPGVHENGGVYLHTIAWKIAADAMLKRADKVEKGIETILPFRNQVVAGRAEPYIMCNSYFGKETGYRYGTPGQSWRTAAGQWFAKALINYVFGLMPEMEGLKIDPCLPLSWTECSIAKHFRGAEYEIVYDNHGTKVKSIIVNGEEIIGNILPCEEGRKYNVRVTLCSPEVPDVEVTE